MGMNITRDGLLDIVKEIILECYDNIRKQIEGKHGVPKSVVCNQCHTPNVLPCDPMNKTCNRQGGKCAFHEIHKPLNCRNNNLCNEICKRIEQQHRFRNKHKSQSFQGPTWINTDASKWCTDPWQIAKCYLSKDGYKEVNKAEDTDFNGIINVIINCEYFQTFFKDDLTPLNTDGTKRENVCTKAKDVRQSVCHSCTMSMTSQDSDKAIDTLVALVQSLKHVDHQAASLTTVDKLTKLKNGTLHITDEDIVTTFEHFKEILRAEIREILEKDKDSLVKAMEDALKNIGEHITEAIIKAGDGQLALIKRKGDELLDELGDVVAAKKSFNSEHNNEHRQIQHSGLTGEETTSHMNSTLSKIQAWLIEQYQTMCVAPVSMLNTDIDVPLDLIYVAPSIKELNRSQKNKHVGHETDQTSQVGTDVNSYNGLLLREGKPVNTIYIQGNPGCGKTTFATKLVLDWCKAHSTKAASKVDTSSETTSEETSKQTTFADLDTLQDYTFLFFVSLRDYSGSMCNVSQMIEDAIKSNKLSWDDSIWEQKCIVLTDAADEWYHPELPFPSPSESTCKCRKDRSMPQYVQRTNITSIITARPWKLADLSISDTLTRLFEITGVLNYRTLAENVLRILAEKDSMSEKDREAKITYLLSKISDRTMNDIIKIPAMCVQFVHQFYIGRLIGGSLCAIYSSMLDMHIARGLQKLQIKQFDTEEHMFGDVPDIFRTETTEYVQGNFSLVCSASKLAFTMLTDTCKQSSLVISETQFTKHMTKTELDYLLQTGIITKKKSLALCPRKNVSYMFVHKTIQEFLASLYITMNQTAMDAILHAVQLTYCDGRSILDIGQLFIFTCGMCPLVAERMSKHIADIITSYKESTLQDIVSYWDFTDMSYEAQRIILDGYTEGEANGQQCLHLTLSHITYEPDNPLLPRHGLYVFKTLIDINISNIVSIVNSYGSSRYRLHEVLSQSRETLSYLYISGSGHIDLQGLKLKYFECLIDINVDNLDCSNMVKCILRALRPSTERVVFKTLSENIKFLIIVKCESIDLLCAALPTLRSLHSLTLFDTKLANIPLHDYLPQSIRKVEICGGSVSSQVIRSMAKWSMSRDVCVECTVIHFHCPALSAEYVSVYDWIQQQDGINIHFVNSFKIVWKIV